MLLAPVFTNKMNTPQQIHTVMAACRTKPKFPAHVGIDGLDAYNPIHQSDKQKLFRELHAQGLLQFVSPPTTTGVTA